MNSSPAEPGPTLDEGDAQPTSHECRGGRQAASGVKPRRRDVGRSASREHAIERFRAGGDIDIGAGRGESTVQWIKDAFDAG